MLRLDPAHPPLWRSATCLQFGTADVARLDDPQPWEEQVVAALERGLTEPALVGLARSAGASADALDALLADLAPVVHRVPPAVRVALDADGVPVHVADTVFDALQRAGADVVRAGAMRATDRVVVVLATHLVAPHRTAGLVGHDIAHVPLVLDSGGATVGPYVEPGVTGCLACDALHARDADAAWPVVASQLLGRTCEVDLDLAVEAARVALHVVTARETVPSRSVRLRRDSPLREWRRHAPHEACRCRSLEETSTAPARLVPAREPSSRTGFARPA